MILAHAYISAASTIDPEELGIAIKAVVPSILSDPLLFWRDSSGSILLVVHQALNSIDGFDAIIHIESSTWGAGVQHFLLTSLIASHIAEVIDNEASPSLLISLARSERTYGANGADFDKVVTRQELGDAIQSARDTIETMRAARFQSHPEFLDPADPRRHNRWEDHYPSSEPTYAL